MVCSNGKTLSYHAALSIRGLSAIEIMLGHIGIATGLSKSINENPNPPAMLGRME